MFQGLEHTAIASPDPEKLAGWYVETLGFWINHRYGGNVFVKAPDGTMLEIIPSEGERTAATLKTPGIRHIAITVSDFDAAHEKIRAAGVKFAGEPLNLNGNLLVFFHDGDGNLLHLLQRPQPLP